MMSLPHVPTDKTKAEVSALLSFGNTQVEICSYLDISDKTFLKYYAEEIRTAVVRANAGVARKLYNKAMVNDDLQAQIFWLKTRARWRTVDVPEDKQDASDTLTKIQGLVADLNKTNVSDI